MNDTAPSVQSDLSATRTIVESLLARTARADTEARQKSQQMIERINAIGAGTLLAIKTQLVRDLDPRTFEPVGEDEKVLFADDDDLCRLIASRDLVPQVGPVIGQTDPAILKEISVRLDIFVRCAVQNRVDEKRGFGDLYLRRNDLDQLVVVECHCRKCVRQRAAASKIQIAQA